MKREESFKVELKRIVSSTKKMLALVLVMLMTMSMMTGCLGGTFPKTASAMAVSYKEQLQNVQNYSMSGTFSGNVEIKQSDSVSPFGSFSLPVNITMNGKVDGKGHAYYEITASMELLGNKTSQQMDIYVEYEDTSVTTYTHMKSQDKWTKQTVNVNKEDLDLFGQQDEVLNEWFDKATIEDTGSSHIVTQKMADILNCDSFKQIVKRVFEKIKEKAGDAKGLEGLSDPEGTISKLVDMLGDASIIYTFDDNKLLTNFKTKDFVFDYDLDMSALTGGASGNMSMKFSMDMNMDMKDYGRVNEEDCIIPEEDKAKAEDAASIFGNGLDQILNKGENIV